MLKNHGPVVMGKTLTEAFIKYWALQRACEIQLATMSMGKAITVPQEVIAVHQRDLIMASIRSEEHTSELQSLMRTSYAVFWLRKTNVRTQQSHINNKH